MENRFEKFSRKEEKIGSIFANYFNLNYKKTKFERYFKNRWFNQ